MDATGLFFLTSAPSVAHITTRERGDQLVHQFNLLERHKRGTQRLVAYWSDPDASLFVDAYRRHLVRGAALRLKLDRIRPHPTRDGLIAFITDCQLAPERWPSYHAEPALQGPAPSSSSHP